MPRAKKKKRVRVYRRGTCSKCRANARREKDFYCRKCRNETSKAYRDRLKAELSELREKVAAIEARPGS